MIHNIANAANCRIDVTSVASGSGSDEIQKLPNRRKEREMRGLRQGRQIVVDNQNARYFPLRGAPGCDRFAAGRRALSRSRRGLEGLEIAP
jgi:hypothetical protein